MTILFDLDHEKNFNLENDVKVQKETNNPIKGEKYSIIIIRRKTIFKQIKYI